MHDRFDRRDERARASEAPEPIDPTEEILLVDLDDLTGVGDEPRAVGTGQGRAFAIGQWGPRRNLLASGEVLSTSLPISARLAYDAFCDVDAIPRWLSFVESVRVSSWTPDGRATRASFVGRLQRGALHYTLFYRHSDAEHAVSWGTAPGATTLIAGRAQFLPLGERATLMEYELTVELPEDALLPWEDPFSGRHATSVVMNDFREYVIGVHGRRRS
ncbi:MAG TPA: SRPBCC family protein [Kofleriaceae bacterium]|nr:SRPBCC family protein [Kofleriaceae bacterium]